ncbi:MAG TPA: hypothetical protein VK612_00035 [Pyrinomonadaceae bacterium]|nr:hypothetical protein [Pyrinomonadaceae bacterium]
MNVIFAAEEKARSILGIFMLLVVLFGLLFSHGEGIRLFPFPLSGPTQTGQLDYQKNVHRIEKNKGVSGILLQSDTAPQPQLLGSFNSWESFGTWVSKDVVPSDASFTQPVLVSRISSSDLNGRAPPVS